jgi:branched-chain amino acid transport system permease protein
MNTLLNELVQGIMLGGLYTLFASGLSLTAGVMRFVNVAHGDFIVLAGYALVTLATVFGLSPVAATIIILPIAFGVGYVLQRLLLQRLVGKSVLLVILVTFGLAIIIENGLLEVFGANTQKLSGGWCEGATISVGAGVNVGVLSLMTFVAAILVVGGLDLLLYRTGVGAKIRAVSDDVAAADLIGLSSAHVYAFAMGISFVTIAIAAGFMSIWSNFDPSSGPARLLVAFEVTILGGLGSMWGSLAGGIVIGVAQSVGGQFDIAWQALAGHVVFLLVLVFRPQGLFPK